MKKRKAFIITSLLCSSLLISCGSGEGEKFHRLQNQMMMAIKNQEELKPLKNHKKKISQFKHLVMREV